MLDAFPYAYAMAAAAALLMLDGALLYTRMPWAHRLGLKLRDRRSPADPSQRDALEPEVVQIAGQVGATTLSDGSLSAWSNRAHFGFMYGALMRGRDPSTRRLGVPLTSHVGFEGDEVVTSTYLRLGPASTVPAFALMAYGSGFPWFAPLIAASMGATLFMIVAWVCARGLKPIPGLVEAVVGASSVSRATGPGREGDVSFGFEDMHDEVDEASSRVDARR